MTAVLVRRLTATICLLLLWASGVAAEEEEESHYLYDGADAAPVQEYHGVYVL
jgi:hypothetical protein